VLGATLSNVCVNSSRCFAIPTAQCMCMCARMYVCVITQRKKKSKKRESSSDESEPEEEQVFWMEKKSELIFRKLQRFPFLFKTHFMPEVLKHVTPAVYFK